MPLLEAVIRNSAAPEGALKKLDRAYWESIHMRIPSFEGAWMFVADLMDELEYYEPRPDWRAQEPSSFGSEEAVQRVRTALAALATADDTK